MDEWIKTHRTIKLDVVAKLIQYHLKEKGARAALVRQDGDNVTVTMDPESRPVRGSHDGSRDKIVIFSAFPKNFPHIIAVCAIIFQSYHN